MTPEAATHAANVLYIWVTGCGRDRFSYDYHICDGIVLRGFVVEKFNGDGGEYEVNKEEEE